MANVFIVLLKNLHLVFCEKKPTKRGNYMSEVRLFKVSSKATAADILDWTKNEQQHSKLTEVTDWQ